MIKGQSKWASFWEANSNTFIGFIITLICSPFIYKSVGIVYSGRQLWLVTLAFTIISVIRGYVIRRFFNKSEAKKDSRLEQQVTSWKHYANQIAAQLYEERRGAINLVHQYRQENDNLRSQVHLLSDLLSREGVEVGEVADLTWNQDTLTHEM